MNTPIVSVIIPWHLDEMAPYVTLCLDSLKAQNFKEIEVIVYSCVTKAIHQQMEVCYNSDKRFKFFHDEEKTYYASKCNRAIERSDPESKYLLLGSDDIILSSNALHNMVTWSSAGEMILNPLCNTDLGFYFHGQLQTEALTLKKFMRIEETKDKEWSLMTYKPTSNFLIPTEHNCFYATLISRRVWNKIGKLDEKFKTGYEDTDYCMRAKKMNIPTFFTTGAFIFHYGGATSSKTVTDEDRIYNAALFNEKYGIK